MKKTLLKLMFSALVLCCAPAVFSQSPTAALTGTVTDPNGAVIPNATVTATNKATDLSRSVTTNTEGVYIISNLPVGEYLVRIFASGFPKTNEYPKVSLNVGQTIRLNTMLEVSGASELVTIIDSPALDTQTSKVDEVISDEEIENLPLNGRNFLELALLTPGNTIAPNFDPTKTNTVVISSVGGLGRGGNVMIDGTDNNDDVVVGSLLNISQDAVQEFQVATNRFSAEYGRSASSVINVVTKSGTNDVRGSFSFFERDRRLQALPATFDRTQPTPPFDRQQYSFTLGAPLVKNKLFAFGALEYRDQDGAVLVGIRDVPNRRITRGFAVAPLDDLLFTSRLDYLANDRNNNTTNILGVSNTNFSGFGNVLGTPNFGQPVTTAGGVFGSGGPRAFQFAARFSF